jgi:REP element-mobilizing transposase RayT
LQRKAQGEVRSTKPWATRNKTPKPTNAGDRNLREALPLSYANLLYRIFFSTKDRKLLLTEAQRQRLYEYVGRTWRGVGGSALEINGVEEHVHVLAKLRQDKALFDVIRDLKASVVRLAAGGFP